jgi:hemerythrin-like domain-containing protein
MTPSALDVIRDEHHALAGMLTALRHLARDLRDRGGEPDFALLRAILFYIHAFPERLHHPKESELLFPAIRRRDPTLTAVLDRLDADHDRGEHAVHALVMQLLEYEQLGERCRDAFVASVEQFVERYLEHMAVEERDVLPRARALLERDDWRAIDAAFAENRDPLTGHTPSEAYKALFGRIVRLVPAPLGLGPARD